MMYRAAYCEAEAGSERMITFMVASLFVEGMAGERESAGLHFYYRESRESILRAYINMPLLYEACESNIIEIRRYGSDFAGAGCHLSTLIPDTGHSGRTKCCEPPASRLAFQTN